MKTEKLEKAGEKETQVHDFHLSMPLTRLIMPLFHDFQLDQTLMRCASSQNISLFYFLCSSNHSCSPRFYALSSCSCVPVRSYTLSNSAIQITCLQRYRQVINLRTSRWIQTIFFLYLRATFAESATLLQISYRISY